MSYKSEAHRVLIGSLNLLPPGDKIPADDCLALENYRVDQAGALRSRLGMLPFGGSQLGGPIHTMFRRGGAYYFGAGNSVYRSGSASPITAACDGNPVGLAAMNGYTWLMNQAVQGKDDGNNFTNWLPTAPGSAVTGVDGGLNGVPGPLGTYVLYCTFVDATGIETNPGPASAPVVMTTANHLMTISNIPTSSDAAITMRRIYATGGTLGQSYKVLEISDNSTTTGSYVLSDSDATLLGIALEIDHDPPPAAAGLAGPYFSRLLAFNSLAHPNRLWWTKPTKPYAWPGAAHVADGQWVDVGDDGEAILNITVHTRLVVIYKQYSVWRLVGDPDTGTLELVRPKFPVLGSRAMCNAGKVDYVATVDGVYRFNLDSELILSFAISPIFQQVYTQITGDVSIPPLDRAQAFQCSMEFVNDTVLFNYCDGPQLPSKMLVYHVPSERWAQARYADANGGFRSLLYPSATGDILAGGAGGSLFVLGYGSTDAGGSAIFCTYQSRYHDQGQPGSDKVYTNLRIEFEVAGSDAITVILYYNNGAIRTAVGSLINQGVTGRSTLSFALNPPVNPGDTAGQLARNVSVRLECGVYGAGGAMNPVAIHSIYLDYYVEASAVTSLSSMPLDFAGAAGGGAGSGALVKQIKEIELVLDTTAGSASARFSSDLPGNAIALRQTLAIEASTGRRNFQRALTQIAEGRLFNLSISAANAFRFYSARVLMRFVGVYVEAYEAAGGFIWDSMEQNFYHLKRIGPDAYTNPIKRARELEVEIETRGGPMTVALLTDQPGNQMASRVVKTVDTSIDGRKVVRIPLPADANGVYVEGRLFRLQISGSNGYILYGARIEILGIGVYIETYEAAKGALYDSRELDLGSPKLKESRELELDIETSGAVTATLYSDRPGLVMASRYTKSVDTTLTTKGRRKINLPLANVEGRLLRLTISGALAFRLYGARIRVRPIGHFIDVDEAAGGALYDSTPLDLGSQKVKQFRMLELELETFGPLTAAVWTDLPGNALASRQSGTVDTLGLGRRTVQIPLPQGAVPDNYPVGRLLQVLLSGASAYKLYGARVQYREVGLYVEAYEAAAGAVWDSTVFDLGGDHVLDQLRLELDAAGVCTVQLWTDLPGETLTSRFSKTVTTLGRSFVTLVLPADTQGRLVKVVVSSAAQFILYGGALSRRKVGRYLAAGVSDTYRSLDQDFGSERVKLLKRLECDIQTDGPLTLILYTDGPPPIASRYTVVINTSGLRQCVRLRLPGNVRGRLARVEIGGASSGRLYALRAWTRVDGEDKAAEWSWQPFPVEQSESLAAWTPLPGIPETAPEFRWANLPVEATAPEWSWAAFPVIETPAQWSWALFPVQETSDEWTWVDVPLGESG